MMLIKLYDDSIIWRKKCFPPKLSLIFQSDQSSWVINTSDNQPVV